MDEVLMTYSRYRWRQSTWSRMLGDLVRLGEQRRGMGRIRIMDR